jgi:hypothetical protein
MFPTLRGDPLPWLLEPDASNPGVRYFTLVDLLGAPPDASEARAARAAIMQTGPVPAILNAQTESGAWVQPGAGYYPKYQGSVWQIIFLAQFGADGSDARVQKGCDHLLTHNPCPYGGFSVDRKNAMTIHCLEGNLAAALIDLGWLGDERLERALNWLARSITGEGIAPADDKTAEVRYFRSGNSGPGFACSANNYLPCAWGAVKAALALGKIPITQRTASMQQAITQAVSFLLDGNPVEANYPAPTTGKPSRSWFQFGYPIGYVTDVLQNLEALIALGCAKDARMAGGADFVLSKQTPKGQWLMEYTYNGKTWAEVESKGQPSKWVTLRALRVLKHLIG